MEGVAARLDELYSARIPMALVTASPRLMAENVVASLGSHYFKSIVSCDDVMHSKPDPEGYLKAASELGVEIAHCLIFEDSNTGVNAGLASGASVVAITHLTHFEPHPRKIDIASIESVSTKPLSALYVTLP